MTASTLERRGRRAVRRGCAAAVGAAAVVAGAGPAHADVTYDPTGGLDDWNGYRVYLSPATHPDSGGRGECDLEENLNGFLAANNSTNGNFNNQQSNLRDRGYKVRIGNGTFQTAVANSNSWGANLHIPLHSNARQNVPCAQASSAHGTWGIHQGNNIFDELFVEELVSWVGEHDGGVGQRSPGTNDRTCLTANCTPFDTLHEIVATEAVSGYLEIEFHTWNTGAEYLANAYRWSWRIGAAVDTYLGYPR